MEFKEIQQAFAAHIKDPDNTSAPDNIEPRRMAVYQELFFNNVEGFVSSAFPVLKSIFDEQQWLSLVRDFFVEHHCSTPLFLEISQEFLSYLENRYQHDQDFVQQFPAFGIELAHYEWVELDVSVRPERKLYPWLDDLAAENRLIFSETASLLSYQYPVQHISEDFQPDAVGNETTFLLVYRDKEEEVLFIELNAMTANLLNRLIEQPGIVVEEYLQQLVSQFTTLTEEQVLQGAVTTIKRMAQLGIIRQFV